MKIQNKIILLMGGIIMLFVFALLFLWNTERTKLDLFTNERQIEKKYLIDVTIELLGRNLEQFAFDYSFWDDMCDFVKTKNPKFAREMIETGLNTYNSNCIWIFNKNFDLVYSFNNLKSNDLLSFPLNKDDLHIIFSKRSFSHFYFISTVGLIEVRTAPIQPSSDIYRLSEPQGYLIIGRLWNNSVTDKLQKLTTSNILLERIINIKTDTIIQQNKVYKIYKALRDWDGKPLINLVSEVGFPIVEQTKETFRTQLIFLLVFSVVILFSIILFFLKFINKPLKLLTTSLSASDTKYIDNLKYNKDEFGRIARLIIDFFQQKNQIEEEIEERKKINAELTESERRIKDILTNLNLIALILDEKGNVTFCNNYLLKLTGWTKEEMIGKNWFDNFLPEDEKTNIKELYHKNIREGKIVPHIENCILNHNGKRKIILWNNTILKNTHGKIIGVASIGQDITNQKETEQNLIKAKEEAEKANRAKSAFLANISHELRTPLVGILGFAEILISKAKDTEIKEKVEFIYQNGNRLLDTLNALLDLSIIEADKLEVKLTSLEVVSLISEVKKLYETYANSKNLFIKIYVTKEKIFAISDEKLLRQILNNLINNAIKYTNQGGLTISVYKEKSDWVIIKVSDTGIGISKEYLSVIFEPFRQVSEGLSRKYEGAGLGLSITKRFVEAIGGTISVQSEVGKGSTFEVRIPAYKSDDFDNITKENITDIDSLSQNAEEIRQKLSKLKSCNILVVENDESTIELFKSILGDLYPFDITVSGTEALEKCKSERYDLILMDISLKQDMNGIKAMKKIKELENYQEVPLIAVTAHAMRGQKEELLKKGFTSYLQKPFTKMQLFSAMIEVLDKK